MKRARVLMLAVAGLSSLFQLTAAQASPVSGILTLNLVIYLGTAIPSGGTVNCQLTATSIDVSSGSTNSEIVSAAATVSGSTANCQLVIPYYWDLATPGTDEIVMSYTASIIPSGSNVLQDVEFRTGSHSLPTIVGVPASGSHSTLYAETRL
jgi:hypothetical protein